jgi:hypothetical protein
MVGENGKRSYVGTRISTKDKTRLRLVAAIAGKSIAQYLEDLILRDIQAREALMVSGSARGDTASGVARDGT